jgi:hypothetical protein
MLFTKSSQSFMKFGLLCTLVFLVSCGSDDEPTPDGLIITKNLTVNRVFDIDNQSNGQDIFVSVTVLNTQGLSQVRAIIAESSALSTITKTILEELPAISYSTLDVTGRLITTRLNSEQTDIHGVSLSLNTEYQVLVYNPSDHTISAASSVFTLTNIAPLVGEYVGVWNDNLFSDIEVSARITSTSSNDQYSGDFFISTNLSPAWGGVTDGDISFSFTNNQIEDFRYDQNLPDYRGGCPGVYIGTGEIENDITITINFTGDDCDGHHEDGVITLMRTK